MGIAAKLAMAARACGYVQKDSANAFHKYRYASAANVLGHVNEALHEAGLAVVDTMPEILLSEGSGKDRVVTVRMTVVVADTESEERATFRGIGSGMDSGDKAVMKACTAALKYAWLGAFSVSTGDDPEADEDTDRRASSTRGGTTRPQAQPRREEPRASEPQRVAAAAPREELATPEPPAALDGFYACIDEIELPGESVKVWVEHRGALATVTVQEREAAWKAICKRTEEIGEGKMKNAKVWLKQALAEHDARATDASTGAQS